MNRVLGVGLPQDKIAPLIWVLWVLGFALFSVFIDRELGYDVGHYYIQTGWAALNDRFATDLAQIDHCHRSHEAVLKCGEGQILFADIDSTGNHFEDTA